MPHYRLHQGLNAELECEFAEMDPTGRYGRYTEVLGKGASKTVYRAFDEIEGMEVAWNQVKIKDVLQTPEDLERLYSEVHLLKTLKHKNIIRFYYSWVDTKNRNVNFVTEMFTSGNLRQYRQKHKRVDVRALKNWSRQILRGLLYLHSHDPPIIHRDLKCDNIFVNGNQGEVKIGDLGLAAILRKSHAAHTIIGTPEFMAPELYEEEYNELVDIYAFGMCLLEMVTFEYPYSECSNPAQIYKKVSSGKKPAALYRVKDPEVRQFVEKCLATVSRRLPARELLNDPFLRNDGQDSENSFSKLGIFRDKMEELVPFVLEPRIEVSQNGGHNTHRNMQIAHPSGEDGTFDQYEDGEHHKVVPLPSCFREDDFSNNRDFAVKGKKRDDDTIFLRLRITDKEGRIRNIYFPFDVEGDTSLSVASEMVTELDITDQDVTKIADMIDAEILELVPDWKAGADREDCPDHTHFLSNTFLPANFSNCYSVPGHTSPISSDSSLLEYMESYDSVHNGTEAVPCTHVECAAVHGRFEEVTYKVDGPDFSSNVAEETSNKSSDVLRYDADDCANGEGPISPKLLILHGSGTGRSDESQCCQLSSAVGNKDVTDPNARTESTRKMGLVDEAWRHGLSERFNPSHQKACFRSVHESQVYPTLPSSFDTLSDEDEGSVSRALRLLTANYREELKELQRKHELALLEIQNHWRKNKKAPRVSPNRAKFSTKANDQEWKMSPNGWQEHQKNDRSRRCRAALDTLKYESKEFESAGMKRLTSDVGRMGISGIHSFRSLPAARSPPPRPDMRNSPPNRRLAKMHSFGDVDGQLHVNSLATDIRNLQHDHTIGALRTQNPYISKSCHGGMRHPLSIPKRYSSGNYVEGRTG